MIYKRPEIVEAINLAFIEMAQVIDQMDSSTYEYCPPNKWTSGQHIQHLILATKPVLKSLSIPKFVLKYKFGMSNRPCRSYDYVLNKYKTGLASGYKAPKSVARPVAPFMEKDKTIQEFLLLGQRVVKKVNKWSEKDLDRFILPHPAMGRMPIREILFFTEFHTLHHLNIIKEQYINQ